ncbi:MAG: LacI family DNA-binding transcriptional regulator [Beutenbergiaceae bacterium]
MSERAGVSRATASLVLRGSPRVSAATAQRVQQAMSDLGYIYDRAAANLRQSRSMTVGLVMTDLANPFFGELTVALEDITHKAGHTLFLGYTRDDLRRQREILSALIEHRVDGLCLLPAKDTTEADLQPLVDREIPHVLFTRHLTQERAYVGADNVEAGRMLGRHLKGIGVRTASFLGGQEVSSRRERIQGLNEVCADSIDWGNREPIYSAASPSGGAAAVEQLLATGDLPDCIVAYNDIVAMGVCSALRHAGIRPGESVAVASFDDIQLAAEQVPPLTSVATHADAVGVACATRLLAMIEGTDTGPRRVLVEPALRVRASTGAWRPR